MTEPATPPARIEARLSPEALALVKRAAEIEGRSVHDFVVSAAQDAARRTIAEVEVIRLAREAQETFAALILDPPEPSIALRRNFADHRRLIRDVR